MILDSHGSEVDVRVEFAKADPATGGGNGITTVAGHQEDGHCDRLLVLRDGNEIAVTAQQDRGDPEGRGRARLCPIAEQASMIAKRKLENSGVVPRRTAQFDTRSLARRDACTLLDADTLARDAGIPDSTATPGFGEWECEWDSSASDTSVHVRFDQDSGLDENDGTPTRVGSREVYVDPSGDGDDTCVARVGYRTYFDTNQDQVVELMILVVEGPQPVDELCTRATALAGSLSL